MSIHSGVGQTTAAADRRRHGRSQRVASARSSYGPRKQTRGEQKTFYSTGKSKPEVESYELR